MFTGIIQAVGKIDRLEPRGGDTRVRVGVQSLDMSDVQLGDSIAVNGVCLTAVAFDARHFEADVSVETLRVTTLGQLRAGSPVNLEKALTPTTRLGGHLVSGHVDGIGEVISRKSAGRAEQFILRAPDEIKKYIAQKGSICVDGISLTVNAVRDAEFELTIVPHTQTQTTINAWREGSLVNLEVDLLARYVERLLQVDKQMPSGSNLTESVLARAGFMRAP